MYTVTACTVCVFSDLFTDKNIHHLQPLEQFVHVELLERDKKFNSDKEINNKIKIHQYKTQHRFTTHKENL